MARRMDKVNVIINLKHLHFIHLRVRFENQDWWWFSLVYASPIKGVRGELRNYLHNISTSNPDRWWMMADDFNDILIQEEKKGGAPTYVRKCFIFHQRINGNNLMDLGFMGSKYTWRGPFFGGHQLIF